MSSHTKITSSSMKNLGYLIDVIRDNAHVVTIPSMCWEKVYKNPVFELAEGDFLESWRQLPVDLRRERESFNE